MHDALGVVAAVDDVVQIRPDVGSLGATFAVVTEVAAWGVKADVYGPNREVYPVRLPSDQYFIIGKAVWKLAEEDDG